MEGELIVAGDFNAKAFKWGEGKSDSRGVRVLDIASRMGLVVFNTFFTFTFRRADYRETIPDVSRATESLAAHVRDWQVIEEFTASEHQYITFYVHDGTPSRAAAQSGPPGWNVKKMHTERLSLALGRGQQTLAGTDDGAAFTARAEVVTSVTMRLIHQACVEAIPRSTERDGRRTAYWWTDQIAELRRKCLSCRSVAQGAKKSDHNAVLRRAEYIVVERALG